VEEDPMADRPTPASPGASDVAGENTDPVVDLRERAWSLGLAGDDDFAVEWQLERPAPREGRRPSLV
jgi:hypothetical protein